MKKLNGIHIALVVASGFDDGQVSRVAQLLRSKGAEVGVVGLAESKAVAVSSLRGTLIKPDKIITEVNAEEIDALIITGGDSVDIMMQDERVLMFLLELNSANKAIGSIGNGTEVLAMSGLLGRRRVTGDVAIRGRIEESGAVYLEQGVVVDHNLVTSMSDMELGHFVEAISILLEPAAHTNTKS